MIVKVLLGIAVAVVLFLGYVATRPGQFRYERSQVIQAPADQIFPYISQLRKGGEWSPYEKRDPKMIKEFSGEDGQVGSKMTFNGNREVGAGTLEVIRLVPGELVDLRLLMTKPMKADHIVEYRLTPEGTGTRFTWAMHGDGGFFGKLMSVVIDCDKMIGGEFELGIENLKKVVEGRQI